VEGAYDGAPLAGEVREGALIARVHRDGGGFDPEGCRGVDVVRAQDIAAVVEGLGGRWVFVTLTLNREWFTCPEAAYQRCNDYVRKVLSAMSGRGIFICAFEVQSLNGDGWPHWHGLVWAPDDRSLDDVKAAGVKAWRTTTEHVDEVTGEVVRSRELIGWVDVQAAKDRKAVGIYVSKYITKAWPAVPAWMGQSDRKFRKVRWSDGVYDVIERLHRRDRVRGSRRPSSLRGRRPARPLFERMASSASSLDVFKVGRWGEREYVATVPIPIDRVKGLMSQGAMRMVRPGRVPQMVFEISPGLVELALGADRWRWKVEGRRFVKARRRELEAAWRKHQVERKWERRVLDGEDVVPAPDVVTQ
jgi:hypothetical protein